MMSRVSILRDWAVSRLEGARTETTNYAGSGAIDLVGQEPSLGYAIDEHPPPVGTAAEVVLRRFRPRA
jgi:hypothetical protein